jgi:hypothetical protein
MNCAWCSPSDNGTDGICDACMQLHFGVDPATIHAEIAAKAAVDDKQYKKGSCRKAFYNLRGPVSRVVAPAFRSGLVAS